MGRGESSSSSNNKTRMGVMLRQSLGARNWSNQVEEIEELKERYKVLQQRLKKVKTALKERHVALKDTAKAKADMAEVLESLSQDSPLEKEAAASLEAMKASAKKTQDRADDFESFAMNYLDEWTKTMTKRLDQDIKHVESLRRDAEHYENKVESLKANKRKLENQDKPKVTQETIERLDRNQTKHNDAQENYQHASQQLYILMDELVDRSWRDLHPLLVKLVNFDLKLVNKDNQSELNTFDDTIQDLKKMRSKHNLPKNRLEDVANAKPKQLSTRPAGERKAPLPPPAEPNLPPPPVTSTPSYSNSAPESPQKEKRQPLWGRKDKDKDNNDDYNNSKNSEPNNSNKKEKKPFWGRSSSKDTDDDDDNKNNNSRNNEPKKEKKPFWGRSSSKDTDDDDDGKNNKKGRSNSRDSSDPYSSGRDAEAPSSPSQKRDSQPYSYKRPDSAEPSNNQNYSNNAPSSSSSPSKSNKKNNTPSSSSTPSSKYAAPKPSYAPDSRRKPPQRSNSSSSDSSSSDSSDSSDSSNDSGDNNQRNSSNRAKPSGSSSSRNAPAGTNRSAPASRSNGRNNAPPAPSNGKKPAMPARPPRATGAGAKRNTQQEKAEAGDHKADAYLDADPAKWKQTEERFSGGFVFETKGKTEEKMAPIKQGIKHFRENPSKYLIMFYQTNMLDWPTNQQRYIYIHREGSVGYKPTGVNPKAPMTVLTNNYQRLPPLPGDELPMKHRDKYTDQMVHQRRKLHSKTNRPILPGRGMGVGDTPDLKIIGDVDPSDIHQGSVGDCWLLSGISSLAEFDGAVKKLFRKTKNLDKRPLPEPNEYIVTLWDLETWTEKDIVIDERLPVKADGSGQLLASKPSEDGELWVCYLEKALAAHCGGWDKITGGQCTHAWALMTGCKYQYTIQINPKTRRWACYGKWNPNERRWAKRANSPHDGEQSLWPNAWPGGGDDLDRELTQEELFMKLCAWDDTNFIIGASCTNKSADAGLVDNHAYSVIEAHNDVAGTPIDLIKVRNPWGKGEIEDGEFDDDGPGWDKYPQIKAELNPVVADDGIFWVTKQEFFKMFSTVYLSASDMTEFLED